MEMKEEVEKQRMVDLAEVKKRVTCELEELERLRNEDENCRAHIKERGSRKHINPATMDMIYRYLKKLEADIDAQQGKVSDVQDEMEKKRLVLLDASKERKVLEKLKDRKQSDYNSDLSRKEQKTLDEISAVKFSRGR
jgi:flagellar FliJ protein